MQSTDGNVPLPVLRDGLKPKLVETTPQDLEQTMQAAAVRSFQLYKGFEDLDNQEIASELVSALSGVNQNLLTSKP